MVSAPPGTPLRDTAPFVREQSPSLVARVRQFAWLLIVIGDVGLLAWGALAALAPGCPGACMTNGYESFSKQSWTDLVNASAPTSEFLLTLFRVFGAYNVAFGVIAIAVAVTAFRRGEAWAWWALLVSNTIAYGSAMTYDRTVGFIGINEMLEYVCLAGIYLALAVTAPFYTRSADRWQ